MAPNPERVRIDVDGHVARVALVRADKHNGLDLAMFNALADAAAELRDRDDVHVAVLYGEGPSFCAGLDFKAAAAMGREGHAELLGGRDATGKNLAQRAGVDWLDLPMPVIAALHGHCLGGGCQIALGADIRYAAPDTTLQVKEIVFGLIPDMGISRSLPALVPIDVAKELVLSGRIVGAEEALALGLVTRVVDDPLAAALAFAEEVAGRSPAAIRHSKHLLNRAYAPNPELLAMETALQFELQSALPGMG